MQPNHTQRQRCSLRQTLIMATLALLALLAAPNFAAACGAVFTVDSTNAAVGAQRAFMVIEPERIQVTVQLTVDTDSSDFAWVLPVTEVEAIDLGDRGLFNELDFLTRPRVELFRDDSGGGGGCGCGSAEDGASAAPNDGVSGGVQRFGGGNIGSYTYDVLGGESAQDMVQWLQDNGYTVPDATASVLQPYADAGMRFVWAKLNPDVPNQLQQPEPLAITMKAPPNGVVTYPLSISQLSPQSTNPVLIYTLANTRYAASNFESATLPEVAAEARRLYEANAESEGVYNVAVDNLTTTSNNRLFVTEYARDLNEEYLEDFSLQSFVTGNTFVLTRLYAQVPSAELVDVQLQPSADISEVRPSAQRHSASDSSFARASFGLTLLLVLAFFFLSACRRRVEYPPTPPCA